MFGEGEIPGIDNDGEVGAATELIGGVVRIVEAMFKMGAEGGSEMRSCGEAEDADAIRIDVPFDRMRANNAEGALGVLESCRGFWIGSGVGNAIFNENAGDTGGGQPIADFRALEVDGEDAIGSSRENDDGCAGAFIFRRIERESR